MDYTPLSFSRTPDPLIHMQVVYQTSHAWSPFLLLFVERPPHLHQVIQDSIKSALPPTLEL